MSMPALRNRFAPLPTSFLVAGMMGVLISVFYVRKFSLTWAFTIGLLSACLFFASMVSMQHANPDAQLKM